MIESSETLFHLYASATWIWSILGAILIWVGLLWQMRFGSHSKIVYWWCIFLVFYSIFVCGGYMAADYLSFGNRYMNIFCGAVWVGIVFMQVMRVKQWYELRDLRRRIEELKKMSGE